MSGLNDTRIVLFNLSTWQLLCGWYVLLKELGMASMKQTSKKNLDVKCFPLSAIRSVGGA